MKISLLNYKNCIYGAVGDGFSREISGCHPSLKNSAGVRVFFRTNSAFCKTALRFERIDVSPIFGASLVNGISFIVSDCKNKQILKQELCLFRQAEEYAPVYEFKRKRDVTVQFFLPSMNCISDIFLELEDDAYIEPADIYPHTRPIVFLGGPVTLGYGTTFANAMFSQIISRRLSSDFCNLSVDGNAFLDSNIASAAAKLRPWLVVAETSSIGMTYEYLCANLENYLLTLLKSTEVGTKILLMTQLFFGYREREYQMKKDFVSALIRKLNESCDGRLFVFDGERAFDKTDTDRISYSANYINDYGNYILGEKISAVADIFSR